MTKRHLFYVAVLLGVVALAGMALVAWARGLPVAQSADDQGPMMVGEGIGVAHATFTPTSAVTRSPTALPAPLVVTEMPGVNSPISSAPPPSPPAAPTPTAPAPEPPSDAPTTVNGIARARVAVLPEDVLANSREIFAQGQQMGRNPRAFSKLGDSVIAAPFLEPYDVGNYDLGIYHYLQGVVDYFAGSFARDSASLRIGLHSWTVFDPMWADKSRCEANEGSLPCELRLHNPSFLIIRLGSNDVDVGDLYEREMERIVVYSIENGVVPILGTKADRNEGSNYNNQVVRRLAAEYQVPLWDFDLVAETVPGRGLEEDGIHLDGNGHFMQNVSALVVLDRLWREVIYGEER